MAEQDECCPKVAPPRKEALVRSVIAEFFGTAVLVLTVIGSGIQGELLSPDTGVALMINAIATWGILYVLISTLGDVSGCHINPYVSLSFFLRRELSGLELVLYIVCQVAGGIVGAFMAHGMFKGCTNTAPEKCITSGRAVGKFDGKDRSTDGEFFSEIVATFLLLFIILSCLGRRDKERIPMAVGLYIQAGYFFTSSTSFANGAVTIGRMFTDSFASIAPSSAGRFIAGQLIGVILVLPFFSFLQEQKLPADSIAVLLRRRKICCPKPASSNSLGHTA